MTSILFGLWRRLSTFKGFPYTVFFNTFVILNLISRGGKDSLEKNNLVKI